MMSILLYLHFPFCKQKCSYCDFCSFVTQEDTIRTYCDVLCEELKMLSEKYNHPTVSTVFLGGGTPSIVPVAYMQKVLQAVQTYFSIAEDAECTTEANPATLTKPWLKMVQSMGINRVSLGVQAIQPNLLKILGRIHTKEDVKEAIDLCREVGIVNISVDLMIGLPTQTLQDVKASIQWVSEEKVSHISCYSLIVEEETPLARQIERGTLVLPDEDLACDMQEKATEWLEELGYKQYEISNYAKKGRESRHNIGYWIGEWYLGVGLSAHSFVPCSSGTNAVAVRVENTNLLTSYLTNNVPIQTEISKEERIFEHCMLGLRMNEGINKEIFQQKFACTLRSLYAETMDQLVAQGLAYEDDKHFFLTQKGLLLQNQVALLFM